MASIYTESVWCIFENLKIYNCFYFCFLDGKQNGQCGVEPQRKTGMNLIYILICIFNIQFYIFQMKESVLGSQKQWEWRR